MYRRPLATILLIISTADAGTVGGTVNVAGTDSPVLFTSVILTQTGESELPPVTAVTDIFGRWELEVAPGTYRIRANCAFYESWDSTVVVPQGGDLSLTISLEASAAADYVPRSLDFLYAYQPMVEGDHIVQRRHTFLSLGMNPALPIDYICNGREPPREGSHLRRSNAGVAAGISVGVVWPSDRRDPQAWAAIGDTLRVEIDATDARPIKGFELVVIIQAIKASVVANATNLCHLLRAPQILQITVLGESDLSTLSETLSCEGSQWVPVSQ